MSRRQFILLALQLIAASQLSGCRASRPVIGRNPIKKPLMVEDHSQLLAHWAEKGIRDAVLINIDTHDDIRWIPDKKIDALRNIYKKNDWQEFKKADGLADDALYHIGNWIYAGGQLGMFREVYWVIPFNVFSQKDPELQLRRFLKQYEFNDQEIQSFSLRDNQFRGTFHGIPFVVCDIESLPDISSPLLLSIDTDFFPPYSNVHEISYLPALHALFQALYSKKYQILDAAVCYSVNCNFLPPYLRWVGDTIGMILEQPGMIDEQPTELLTLLQQIDNDYRSTDSVEMLKFIDAWQSRYPVASIQLYKAYAYMLQNDPENAYKSGVRSCATDNKYCTGLADIGTYYFSKNNCQMAEKFFLAGFAVDPNMGNGLFQYGHCLRQMGRIKEALAIYEKDEAINGSFPTRFLIAEIYLTLRDKQSAIDSINKSVGSLMQNRYAEVVNSQTARAVYAILDFCNREKLSDLSFALHSSPVVVKMFSRYPRK